MNDVSPSSSTGMAPGILVGLLAALVGAGIYAAIMGLSGYRVGIAAIGIGVLVGLAMMAFKSTSPVLPILAGVISLLGCAIGEYLGSLWIANEVAGSLSEAVKLVNTSISEIMGEDPKLFLFWAIAAIAGYSFVNRRVKAAAEAQAAPPATPPAGGPSGAAAPSGDGSGQTPQP